jgi:formylglycine-generating enzyme required for sulfatase activity
MSLSGEQYQRLEEALLHAFRDKLSLRRMLKQGLDKNLNEIAGGDDLQNIVFKLIDKADAEGWVPDLINAGLKSIPKSKLLQDIAAELLPNDPNLTVISPLHKPLAKLTQQQKILILAAIPHGLRLDNEIREIEEAILRSRNRDLFEIRIKTAVRSKDILRAIAEEQPQIIHFCGHGLEDGSLLLEDEIGNNKPVLPEALASLFSLHVNYVKCVLLNACYSEKAAVAISEHIDYVIGMNNSIEDSAAIEFSRGFYDGLGHDNLDNQDVFQRAFNEAMASIKLETFSQGEVPVLKKKYEPHRENRRKFLKWVAFGSGSLAIALLTSRFSDNGNSQSIPPLKTFEFEVVTVDSQGKITNRQTNKAEFFNEDLGNDVTLEMVKIPGGSFMMGTKDEEIEKLVKKFGEEMKEEEIRKELKREQPPRKVDDVPAFFMGKFEVTQEQYEEVMGEGKPKELHENPLNEEFKGDKRPVIFVSWNDAVEFCKKLSQKTGRTYRLPSEAEWEYAARAGTTTRFYFGETITSNLVNYNYKNNGIKEVRQFPPNAFGLYDMHGNVDEWCEDHLHDDYNGAPEGRSAWIGNTKDKSRRVQRGGSWIDKSKIFVRSARRGWWHQYNNTRQSGFRVVCDIS